MKPKSRVTLQKLAEIANTTPATVSRALAGKSSISEATRERLQKLAREHGYYPNELARNVLRKESPFIGFIASDLLSQAYLEVFRIVEGGSRANGKSVLIADSEKNLELERKHIDYFMRMRICGLFLYPASDWDRGMKNDHLDQLVKAEIPVIALGHVQRQGVSTIVDEEWMSTGKLVRHFLDCGHRNFVILDHGETNNVPSTLRRNGIMATLKQQGGDQVKVQTINTNTADEEFPGSFLTFLKESKDPPTACIAINDLIALHVYKPLIQAGFRIPDDISIAAFGRNNWAEHLTPSLTLSEPDIPRLARQATQLMFDMTQGKLREDAHHNIPQRLVKRDSVRNLLA